MNSATTLQTFEHQILIEAPAERIWAHLTSPELMKAWMTEPDAELDIETDWDVGAPITMRGFQHVQFTNTGKVLAFEPHKRLAYSHLSSLSRLPDEPDNYTRFEFVLQPDDQVTTLQFSALGAATQATFSHMKFYWQSALVALKQQVEAKGAATV